MAQVKMIIWDDTAEHGQRVEMVTVEVGDYVGFKSDIEQGGQITAINGDALTLERENGFDGHYIGGQTRTVEQARDCWVDERPIRRAPHLGHGS